MYTCPKCNEKMLTVIEEENDHGCINREKMAVHVDYLRDTLCTTVFTVYEDGDGSQQWCESCVALYVYCCDKPCIITSVCCLSNYGEWYTFESEGTENKKFIKHPMKDWPYEYLNKESNVNIESLGIIDAGNYQLGIICLNGPEGGCPVSYKCTKCGAQTWLNDK